MGFENLTEREKKVLASLISYYITTADPVGSRVLANKFRLGVSPATIRNTMQDLEELGLVQQPHTSAGRIPTDSGYRMFVDYLLRQEPLSVEEKEIISGTISSNAGGIESILDQTSRVLARLSQQLGIAITPKLDNSILSRIELIHMAEGKVLVVLAFKSGLARTILVEVEASINSAELMRISQVLNEKLADLSLGQIRKTVQERLASTEGNPRLLRLFIDSSSEIWSNLSLEKIHVGGTENVLNQPEFSNREKLQGIVKLLEERNGLIEIMNPYQNNDTGIIITIGGENKAREIQSCSVVSAKYEAGSTSGTIGIIGPTRMPYARLVTLVKYAARQLSKAFKGS